MPAAPLQVPLPAQTQVPLHPPSRFGKGAGGVGCLGRGHESLPLQRYLQLTTIKNFDILSLLSCHARQQRFTGTLTFISTSKSVFFCVKMCMVVYKCHSSLAKKPARRSGGWKM